MAKAMDADRAAAFYRTQVAQLQAAQQGGLHQHQDVLSALGTGAPLAEMNAMEKEMAFPGVAGAQKEAASSAHATAHAAQEVSQAAEQQQWAAWMESNSAQHFYATQAALLEETSQRLRAAGQLQVPQEEKDQHLLNVFSSSRTAGAPPAEMLNAKMEMSFPGAVAQQIKEQGVSSAHATPAKQWDASSGDHFHGYYPTHLPHTSYIPAGYNYYAGGVGAALAGGGYDGTIPSRTRRPSPSAENFFEPSADDVEVSSSEISSAISGADPAYFPGMPVFPGADPDTRYRGSLKPSPNEDTSSSSSNVRIYPTTQQLRLAVREYCFPKHELYAPKKAFRENEWGVCGEGDIVSFKLSLAPSVSRVGQIQCFLEDVVCEHAGRNGAEFDEFWTKREVQAHQKELKAEGGGTREDIRWGEITVISPTRAYVKIAGVKDDWQIRWQKAMNRASNGDQVRKSVFEKMI